MLYISVRDDGVAPASTNDPMQYDGLYAPGENVYLRSETAARRRRGYELVHVIAEPSAGTYARRTVEFSYEHKQSVYSSRSRKSPLVE